MRKVYVECEEDLSEAMKQEIEDLHVGMANTFKLNVSCKAEIHYIYVEKPGKYLRLLQNFTNFICKTSIKTLLLFRYRKPCTTKLCYH